MARDPYSLCPCGSGKKIKFCCTKLESEMDKVTKLISKNQSRLAQQSLEKLSKSSPNNPWVVQTYASFLFGERDYEQARELLASYVDHDPEHRRIYSLYAMTVLSEDGYEQSRKTVARAFQRCSRECPEVMSSVAVAIASLMQMKQEYMGARHFLTVAMKVAREEDRRDIFIRLLDLESNASIPYPLRSVHQLAVYVGDEARAEEAQKGHRLAALGCVSAAAHRFEKLTEDDPDNPVLWQNLGFCQAWDGESTDAAGSLHRAAELFQDVGAAVECETIAQLLEFRDTQALQHVRSLEFKVESVSRLLSALDGAERFKRFDVPPQMLEEGEEKPAGAFNILDRDVPEGFTLDGVDLGDIPEVLAELTVFDEDTEEELEQRAYITGLEGDTLDQAVELLKAAAGDEVELIDDEEEDDEDSIVESVPADLIPFQWRWHLPEKTPAATRRKLENEKWNRLLDETWPDTEFDVLDGNTPRQAAADSEQRVNLTALVYVLDAYCTQNSFAADLNRLAGVLGVELLPSLTVADDLNLNSLSAMQLHRLPIADLDDDQLAYTLNRALMIRHSSFLYDVLTEANRRGTGRDQDRETIFATLSEICRDRGNREDAQTWLDKGRDWLESQENNFEKLFEWTLREMRFRLEQPDDPEVPGLLKRIWEYYGPKLPQIREHLQSLVDLYGFDPPWEGDDVASAAGIDASGSDSAGGIWTPGEPAAAASGEGSGGKLWVPGQE